MPMKIKDLTKALTMVSFIYRLRHGMTRAEDLV